MPSFSVLPNKENEAIEVDVAEFSCYLYPGHLRHAYEIWGPDNQGACAPRFIPGDIDVSARPHATLILRFAGSKESGIPLCFVLYRFNRSFR